MLTRALLFGCPLLLLLAVTTAATEQRPSMLDHASIAYARTAPTDAIARLQERIASGAVTLEFDAARGYLPSLLRARCEIGSARCSAGLQACRWAPG